MKSFIKKICICGDPAVGKTSLIRRFVTGDYKTKYITTLGTVISKKIVKLQEQDVLMKLQIWDISGQAEFKRIHSAAFRYAEAAFVVCDLLNPKTAESAITWIENFHQHSNDKAPVFIMVNKYDLIENKSSNLESINKTLGDIDYPVYYTSAKSGHNVEKCFGILAERLIPMAINPILTPEEPVTMPEVFENPYELLDYIMVRFSNTFGDTEMSIHLIRGYSESSGKKFIEDPKDASMKLILKLSDIISNFKGLQEGLGLQNEFLEAYKRCKWG